MTNLQLGPQATIDIKGQAYTLAALVQALIGYQPDDLQMAYDERGQLQIGRYLYTQIFGVLDATERRRLRDTSVDVRLVTEDEHLARLPWAMLVDDSVFLSTAPWPLGHVACQSPQTAQSAGVRSPLAAQIRPREAIRPGVLLDSELTPCRRNTNHQAALQAFAIFTFT